MSNPGKCKKISLFGNFGWGNLGNSSTLEATLYGVRRFLPEAEITVVCTNPVDTSARYGIPVAPVRGWPEEVTPGSHLPVTRVLGRIFLRVPFELMLWKRAFQSLRNTDLLIITGTGVLDDFAIGPLQLPYDLFKWSVLSKLTGTELLYVSVGAGPIHHPLSRLLMKSALSFADYRSYRDTFSKEYMMSIGFDSSDDPVYPDLAFSLPVTMTSRPYDLEGRRPTVGIGLMTYYGQRGMPNQGEAIYLDYMAKLGTFVSWLLEHGYTVRVLIGDISVDSRAQQDLKHIVEKRGFKYEDGQIIDEPVSSVDELLSQIATTDMVVATRLHNVVLALMLNKPVVSISYNEKNDYLMADVGLAEYCQHIDHLDVDRLIEQFTRLERNAECLKPQIQHKTEEYCRALDEQNAFIFSSV
jgi:polysaccharide pyruvyl transferase WcaK-like protein